MKILVHKAAGKKAWLSIDEVMVEYFEKQQ
jgi:hypothetical protein